MNSYEAKQERRRERLQARADRMRQEGNRRIHEATREGALPPMGEPIKVGHHSEKRHRAAIARSDMNMRKGVEAHNAADEAERRAEGVGTAGISSDDPEAIRKLQAQLTQAETDHANMKRWNVQFRAGGIEAMDAPDKVKASVAHTMRVCSYLREPFLLSNSSANVRRIKDRIEHLQKAKAREHKEFTHSSGMRVVQNVEENRVQLFFPGKPDDATRAMLKQHGFRWSPLAGAWQRHLNNAGVYATHDIMRRLAVQP